MWVGKAVTSAPANAESLSESLVALMSCVDLLQSEKYCLKLLFSEGRLKVSHR